MMNHIWCTGRVLIYLALILPGGCVKKASSIKVDLWYGDTQVFGTPGHAQRWVNILGHVASENGIGAIHYTLNEAPPVPLSLGEDGRRLAKPGDFNIDIDRTLLEVGNNLVTIHVEDSSGDAAEKEVNIINHMQYTWPLPYAVEWDKIRQIQDVVQIVDGKWMLTDEGVRTVEPYYDRVLAIGDSTWKDYEIETTVVFHGYAPPLREPPTFGVTHAAIAMRWPGHDADDKQPHVKWWPLGATCEFQLRADLDSCRWRILGSNKIRMEDTTQFRKIMPDRKYGMKSQVRTLQDGQTRYRVKLWPHDKQEPGAWQLVNMEGSEDIQYGCALLLAHNSDVTFGNIYARPLE